MHRIIAVLGTGALLASIFPGCSGLGWARRGARDTEQHKARENHIWFSPGIMSDEELRLSEAFARPTYLAAYESDPALSDAKAQQKRAELEELLPPLAEVEIGGDLPAAPLYRWPERVAESSEHCRNLLAGATSPDWQIEAETLRHYGSDASVYRALEGCKLRAILTRLMARFGTSDEEDLPTLSGSLSTVHPLRRFSSSFAWAVEARAEFVEETRRRLQAFLAGTHWSIPAAVRAVLYALDAVDGCRHRLLELRTSAKIYDGLNFGPNEVRPTAQEQYYYRDRLRKVEFLLRFVPFTQIDFHYRGDGKTLHGKAFLAQRFLPRYVVQVSPRIVPEKQGSLTFSGVQLVLHDIDHAVEPAFAGDLLVYEYTHRATETRCALPEYVPADWRDTHAQVAYWRSYDSPLPAYAGVKRMVDDDTFRRQVTLDRERWWGTYLFRRGFHTDEPLQEFASAERPTGMDRWQVVWFDALHHAPLSRLSDELHETGFGSFFLWPHLCPLWLGSSDHDREQRWRLFGPRDPGYILTHGLFGAGFPKIVLEGVDKACRLPPEQDNPE